MTKINPEVVRAASDLLVAMTTEQERFATACDRFNSLVARGIELAATGASDGLWFGEFCEACEDVLGEREPALAFGRLLGYHEKAAL